MAQIESTVEKIDAEAVLARYRQLFAKALHQALNDARTAVQPAPATAELLDTFYGQMEYHLGWRHADLSRARQHPGKLVRPTLLLLASELAAGRAGADRRERGQLVRRIAPAAVSIELVHNFSLVHDDIEDGDEQRRHRPTVWKLWGVPQAINAGDALFAMARMSLWRLVENGVAPQVIVRLAPLLDQTCLELCEGQYLDMSYEGHRDVSVPMYMEMIGRKTAALMASAAEIGGRLGAPEDTYVSARLADFGRALGLAFQLRDDLLGIWAPEKALGKVAAGDLRRKKMSLPVIHALQTATDADRRTLPDIYAQDGPATEEQIADALAVLERTGAHARVSGALKEQGNAARAALDAAAGDAPEAQEAHQLLGTLLDFVAAAAS